MATVARPLEADLAPQLERLGREEAQRARVEFGSVQAAPREPSQRAWVRLDRTLELFENYRRLTNKEIKLFIAAYQSELRVLASNAEMKQVERRVPLPAAQPDVEVPWNQYSREGSKSPTAGHEIGAAKSAFWLLLKPLLIERGYTHKTFATEIGISTASLRQWKYGYFSPRSKTLLRITDVFPEHAEQLRAAAEQMGTGPRRSCHAVA